MRDIFLRNMILRNVFSLNLCSHWSTFHYYPMTEFFKGYFRLAEKICSISSSLLEDKAPVVADWNRG